MGSTVDFPALALADMKDQMTLTGLVGYIPGSVYFVDSNTGSSANNGLSRSAPKATLEQALALCTNNRGNVIYVLPGHSETLSSSGVTWSQSGVQVIGGGIGRSRPTFTCYAAAAITGLTISGSNNLLRNVRLVGSDTQTTANILAVTGDDNTFDSLSIEHGAGPLRAVSMSGADRTKWTKCKFIGTANGPDAGIMMTSTCVDCEFVDLLFDYGAAGLDSGAIMTSSATTGFAGNLYDKIYGVGMDLTLIDLNASSVATTCEALISNCIGAFRAGITVTACIDAGGAALVNNFVTDATAAAPVWTVSVDTAASNFPTATPA